MNTFWYGIGFGNDLKIPASHMMISASSCWKKKDGKMQFTVPEIESKPEAIWIDSGGFTCFTKWADYPWSVETYVSFIREFCAKYPQVQYATVMDLPCEPSVKRKVSDTNNQRIHQTIQNTRDCMKHQIPAKWVAVVQGYTKAEYAYCASMMREFNLFTPLTAIGSICQRKKTSLLKEYIKFITTLADVKWHTFGMQISVLKDPVIASLLESSDSGAWKFSTTPHNWKPRTYEDKLKNFTRYSGRIRESVLGDYRWKNLAGGLT